MTDRFAAERALLLPLIARDLIKEEAGFRLRQKVDELALMMAGLSGAQAWLVLDAVIRGVEDEISEEVLNLFLEAVLLRKIQIDRGAAPLRLQ